MPDDNNLAKQREYKWACTYNEEENSNREWLIHYLFHYLDIIESDSKYKVTQFGIDCLLEMMLNDKEYINKFMK